MSRDDTERSNAAVRLAQLEEVEVTVDQLVAGGDGLARFEGIPIFIPRSTPGDRLRVQLTDRKPGYGRAEILEILEPGPGRREPPCPFFEDCGGCDLQHIEDDLQVRLKAEAVRETLQRLGDVKLPETPKVVSGKSWGYRLRTQLHTRKTEEGGVEVGYFRRGSHELVAVDQCPILMPELERRLPPLPDRLEDRAPKRLDLAAGQDGSWTTAPVVEGLPHGEVSWTVGKHTLAYDARVFFQTHRELLEPLVIAAVGPWNGAAAFDLYAGVGLFTLPLAERYDRVVAVESDRVATRYCRNNARRHRLQNVEPVHKVLERWIDELPEDADRVLVDPPRAGLHRHVSQTLYQRPPKRLTYVSCHPATLARDLKTLTKWLRVEDVILFDLFPQTGHMEAVVQLVRRD